MIKLFGKDSEPENFTRVLFVDPGIGGTGLALFAKLAAVGKKPWMPVMTEMLEPKSKHWQAKIEEVCSWFSGIVHALDARLVVIEMPETWGGDARSYAATTKQTKGEPAPLFKLTYLVGGMGEIARQATLSRPLLISPRLWKGQLPKEVVHKRIFQTWGNKYREHEADAVGMGLAAQGGLE